MLRLTLLLVFGSLFLVSNRADAEQNKSTEFSARQRCVCGTWYRSARIVRYKGLRIGYDPLPYRFDSCAVARRTRDHDDGSMKFVERQPFADPDAAARRIVEIANGIEAVQDGRSSSGWRQRRAVPRRIERAVALGWLWRHESGTYLKITEGGGAVCLIHD